MTKTFIQRTTREFVFLGDRLVNLSLRELDLDWRRSASLARSDAPSALALSGAEAASTRSRFYSAATNDFAPDMEMKDMTIAFGKCF